MSDDLIGKTFKGPKGKTWKVTGIQGQYALTESGKLKSCINLGLLRETLRRG